MRITTAVLSLAVLMGLSISANASPINYVYNGDFETLSPDYTGLIHHTALSNLGYSGFARWDVYSEIPGWSAGTGDAGIEVQTDGTVVYGHSSSHYIELDSHGGEDTNSSMSQDVSLEVGIYDLSFWYRPRTPDLNENNINFSFAFGDSELLSGTVMGAFSPGTDWTLYSYSLDVKTAGDWTLMFTADGRDTSYGGFIDDVEIVSAPVPEPATIILLGTMGLVGFAGSRIRKKKK